MMLVGLLVLALAGAKPLEPCPSSCRCFLSEGLKRADCSHVPELADHQSDAQDVRILPTLANRGARSFALHLTHFEVFPKVIQLSVTNRSLVEIIPSGFHGLQELQELDLSHNQLSRFNYKVFLRMPALRRLNLAGNPIMLEPGRALLTSKSLLSLDLSHCEIETVPKGSLDSMKNLTSLSLRSNPLKLEKGRPLLGPRSPVSELDLSNCDLEAIPDGVLTGLAGLRRLYLDGNQLVTINKGVLPRGLHLLDLSNNLIMEAPTAVISLLRNLTKLELGDNPITCTCSLIGLQGWLSRHLVVTERAVICADPPEYRGKPWNKVNEQELCREEEKQYGSSSSSSSSSSVESVDDESSSMVNEPEYEDDESLELPPASYELYTHENILGGHPPSALPLKVHKLPNVDIPRSYSDLFQADQPYDLTTEEAREEVAVAEASETTAEATGTTEAAEAFSRENTEGESMEKEDEDKESGGEAPASVADEHEEPEKDAEVFMTNADTIAMGKSMSNAESKDVEPINVGPLPTEETAMPELSAVTPEPDGDDIKEDREAEGSTPSTSESSISSEHEEKKEEEKERPDHDEVAAVAAEVEATTEDSSTSMDGIAVVPIAETAEGDRSGNGRALGSEENHVETEHHEGEHPAGEHPAGEHPAGEHPTEEHPAGEHSAGENPEGEHPEEKQNEGEHPEVEHSEGEHHEGENPEGESQEGGHPEVVMPEGEHPGEEDQEGEHLGGAVTEVADVDGVHLDTEDEHVGVAAVMPVVLPDEPDTATPSQPPQQPDADAALEPDTATPSQPPQQPDADAALEPDTATPSQPPQQPDADAASPVGGASEPTPVEEEAIVPAVAKNIVGAETETEKASEDGSTSSKAPVIAVIPPIPEVTAPETEVPLEEKAPEPVEGMVAPPKSVPTVDAVPEPEVPEEVVLGSAAVETVAGAVPEDKNKEELTVERVPSGVGEEADAGIELQKSTITYIILGCILVTMVVLAMYGMRRNKAKKADAANGKPSGPRIRRENGESGGHPEGTEMKDMMNPLLGQTNPADSNGRRASLVSLELIREEDDETTRLQPSADNVDHAHHAAGAKGAATVKDKKPSKANGKPAAARSPPNGKPVASAEAPAAAPTSPASPTSPGQQRAPSKAPAVAALPEQPSMVKVRAGIISTPVPRTPVLVNRANGVNGNPTKVNGLNRNA